MPSQRPGFGPWSTALDNGTRMQLSAFWRRRMFGLGQLPMKRTSGRWTAVSVIAALLIAVTPLVEFSSRALAGDKRPDAEKSAGKVEGEGFVWRFSNGLEIELIGMAKNPSKGQAWWRPDGTPLEEASLPAAKFISGGELSREIAFRWRNVPDGPEHSRTWHTVPHYSGAGGSVTQNEPNNSILQVVGASFNEDPKEIVVSFTASVSATPWRKVFDADGRSPMSAGSVVGGKIRSVAFAPAYETKSGVAITVSYGIGEDAGRVIAIDKAGREQLATRQRGVGSTHFDQTTFEFDNLALNDIERFELQSQRRAMETVEFHNVSLEAGHATKVVIEPLHVDHQGMETGYLPNNMLAAFAEQNQRRIDRMPILGPITSGDEVIFLDAPSDEEVLRAFNKSQGILHDFGFKREEGRADQVERIEKKKIEEKVDPLRVYPLIGSARHVHSLYMCELRLKDGQTHKFCVDHNHLHVTSAGDFQDAQIAIKPVIEDEADSMSLDEALKIMRPTKGDRSKVSEEVERQATARIAREEQKLLVELVESGVFTLKPGELVRFVPASESGEARRRLAQLSDDNRRVFLFFKPPAGEVPSLSGGKCDDMNLMDAITDVLGLPIQHVEGLDQTLAQELPEGDWLCFWDRSVKRAPLNEQLVAAFEKTLKGILKEPVSLSIAFKELPVLVATGAYQANPIIDEKWSIPALSPEVAKTADGPFSFPARRGTTINMVSDFQGMLEMVGGLLLKPIINKADPGPTKESYFMCFAEPPQVDLHEPLDEAAAQAVIEAFQKQTSLLLTPARRKMAVLVVGDAK